MAIEAGLRADIFRDRLLNKNILANFGDIYTNSEVEYAYTQITSIINTETFDEALKQYGKLFTLIEDDYIRVYAYSSGVDYYYRTTDCYPVALPLGATGTFLCSRNKQLSWEAAPNFTYSFLNYLNSTLVYSQMLSFNFDYKQTYGYFRIFARDEISVIIPDFRSISIKGIDFEINIFNDIPNYQLTYFIRYRKSGDSVSRYEYYTTAYPDYSAGFVMIKYGPDKNHCFCTGFAA